MVFAPLTTIDISHPSSSQVDRYDALPFAKDISVNTTLIHGDKDTALPLAMSKTLQKRLPHAQLEVVAGVDHLGLLVAPQSRLAAMRAAGKESPNL
jgi:pimeloyl-ACP methyl ester carboxylesterase